MGIGWTDGRVGIVAATVALSLCAASGQSLMRGGGGRPILVGTDLAVLEARDARDDLPCQVIPSKPVLGFDLKFHSGFDISVPLKDLAGSENLLHIVFRVAPLERPEEPVYFTQRIRVPSIEADAKGDAYLQGSFDLGEGKYKVEWLMRDRSERVCASFWEIEAALPAKDKALELSMQPGEVSAEEQEEFTDEPPVERNPADGPLSVKVLVNFAPQNANASSLQPADTSALVSILRSIQREPKITRFSVVAFNLQEQKVLYRQEAADHIDFPAIGESLKGLQLGRVDLAKLADKNSEAAFLGELIRNEFKGEGVSPDGMIIAGPKVMLNGNVPQESLRLVGEPEYPVFYMNYNLYPHLSPWRDTIGNAVRHFKGQEFTISRPRDLWFAVTEMVSKIVKWKSEKRPASAASSSRGHHEVESQ